MKTIGFLSFAKEQPGNDAAAKRLLDAMDASAEDIRCGRTEDTREFLERIDAEIEGYLAGERGPGVDR